MDWIDGLFEPLRELIAGTLVMSLVATLVRAIWRRESRDYCRCPVPTLAGDGPRCSTCERPLDVTTGDRPND